MTDAPEPNADIPEHFHPYVRLLVIRMRSHPEEFNPFLREPDPQTKDFMTTEESAFVWAEERKLILDAMHQRLMQKIMKANEPPEENETVAAKLVALQQMQAMAQSQGYQSSLGNSYNSLLSSQAYNNGLSSSPSPYPYPGTTNAQTIALGYPVTPVSTPTTATITGTTTTAIDTSVLEKMKRALGI